MTTTFLRIFIILNIFCTPLKAQIPAPTLQCIKRDTVIWTLPAIRCGSINSYQIYASRNITGPYQLLATISNANQTRYYHNNIEGGTWYYYMTTNANCAGLPSASSDTINNQLPALNPVLVVTVADNNSVEVRWRRNNSSKVVGYIIYKQTASGLIPIANVANRDTIHYFDRTATPAIKSEGYQVLAVDACGSTSLFDITHNTMRLIAKQSKCNQTINITWNKYKNWANPVAQQEVWLSINGRNPYLYATLPPTDTTFTIRNVVDKDRYRISVQAVQSLTGIIARSNDTIIVADIIQPVKSLFLKNVSVIKPRTVELVWQWNASAKVDSVKILRGSSINNMVEIKRYKPVYPIEDQAFYIDTTALTSDSMYFYRIETKDDCGAIKISNYISTLLLKVLPAANRQNRLYWEPFQFPVGMVTGYQPSRIVNNIPTLVGLPLNAASREYLDIVGTDEPRVCYRIDANYHYTLPDGSGEDATSLSNVVCADQYTKLWTPTAFTPGGKNPEFRPLVTFADNIQTYTMQIYDRWGGVLFLTNNVAQGWDGKKGATDMPEGAYVYFIRMTQANGNIVEQKGILMLLR